MEYIVLYIFTAHILVDFYFQSDNFCLRKRDEGFWGCQKMKHALGIFVATWVFSFSVYGLWLALMIAVAHWLTDAIKAYFEKNKKVNTTDEKSKPKVIKLKDSRYTLFSFCGDQLVHLVCICFFCRLWYNCHNNASASVIEFTQYHIKYVLCAVFALVAGKPSNIFITQVLKYCQVKTDDNVADHGNFRSGGLIGTLERLLMICFVVTNNYEAIGFLIAAKSILRFNDTNKVSEKSEYVLAGTFLSVAISLVIGITITHRCWVF